MTLVNILKAGFNATTEQKRTIFRNLLASWMKAPEASATNAPHRRRAAVYTRYGAGSEDIESFARRMKSVREYAAKLNTDMIGAPAISSSAVTANRSGTTKLAQREASDWLIVEDGNRVARKLRISTKAYSDIGVKLHSRNGKWSSLDTACAGSRSQSAWRRIVELLRRIAVKY